MLDSSTHILNLILWMPSFRAIFAVSRFSGDLERTSVSVPFSKETEVSEMNPTTPKKTASRRERKPKEATASDNCRLCVCCFQKQFAGNFKLDGQQPKTFLLRRRERERRCQCWLRYSEPICPFTLKKRTQFRQ